MKIRRSRKSFQVFYNGGSLSLEDNIQNAALIETLRAKSEEKHLRFEVRYGRVRTVYYYDYDKSQGHEKELE